MSAENEVEKVAPKKLVLSFVRRLNENKARVQSINGEIGVEIREAVENKHLHSAALKAVAKLVRMDPEKRDDFLRAYALYFHYAEEAKLFGAAHTGDLVDEAERLPDVDPVPLSDVVESNVRNLRRGIRPLEDSAQSEEAASA